MGRGPLDGGFYVREGPMYIDSIDLQLDQLENQLVNRVRNLVEGKIVIEMFDALALHVNCNVDTFTHDNTVNLGHHARLSTAGKYFRIDL